MTTAQTDKQHKAQVLRDEIKRIRAKDEEKWTAKEKAVIDAIPPRKSPEEVLVVRLGRTVNYLRKFGARLDEDNDAGMLDAVDAVTSDLRALRLLLQAAPQSEPEEEEADGGDNDGDNDSASS